MARPKKVKAEKVSAETGVDAETLERLPVEALEKLDALVPDQKPEPSEKPSTSESPSDVVVEGKRYVGKHPITGEPVYL